MAVSAIYFESWNIQFKKKVKTRSDQMNDLWVLPAPWLEEG